MFSVFDTHCRSKLKSYILIKEDNNHQLQISGAHIPELDFVVLQFGLGIDAVHIPVPSSHEPCYRQRTEY